jgi:hypothetical protein
MKVLEMGSIFKTKINNRLGSPPTHEPSFLMGWVKESHLHAMEEVPVLMGSPEVREHPWAHATSGSPSSREPTCTRTSPTTKDDDNPGNMCIQNLERFRVLSLGSSFQFAIVGLLSPSM